MSLRGGIGRSMYTSNRTLDDALRQVLSRLVASTSRISPSRGTAAELTGVLIQITDPRARLSRTEKKGTLFSCLGELLWYLSKTHALPFIRYYVARYADESDDGRTIHGGYGPRLFDMRGVDQVSNVIGLLRRNPHSRRAVIQLFDASDLAAEHKDIPCTCSLQFMIRSNRLFMMTTMRSNDAYFGLPHDVFAFTMIQELIARTLNVELGTYKHAVGSLHLYDKNRSDAQKYIDEGWQPTDIRMPAMPEGDPWRSVNLLLRAERSIRMRGRVDAALVEKLDPYWADLVSVLQAYSYFKKKDRRSLAQLRRTMHTRMYDIYVEQKRRALRDRARSSRRSARLASSYSTHRSAR